MIAPDNRRLLVQAILDSDPGDDEARSIYADYLQQHADPRGELIAMQLRALREPSDELARRERQLLDDHEAQWLGPWHRRARRWTFDRGFLRHVMMPIDQFVETAYEIAADEPLSDHLVHIRSLHFDRPTFEPIEKSIEAFDELARAVPMRIESLTIEHDLTMAVAAAYAKATFLQTVEDLHMLELDPYMNALRTVWESPQLGRLVALELRDAGVTDHDAVELAGSQRFQQVRRLAVAGRRFRLQDPIENAGAIALVHANPQLTHLDLGGLYRLDDAVLAAIARSRPPLESLVLTHAQLTSASAGLFAGLSTLRTLDVRHTRLDDLALDPILSLPKLETLNVAHTAMTAEGAAQILRDAPPTLRDLTITMQNLSPIVVAQLQRRFQLHRWR